MVSLVELSFVHLKVKSFLSNVPEAGVRGIVYHNSGPQQTVLRLFCTTGPERYSRPGTGPQIDSFYSAPSDYIVVSCYEFHYGVSILSSVSVKTVTRCHLL